MVDEPKKLNLGKWFVRILFGSAMLGGLFWYGSSHTATISDLTKAIASTNVFIIIGAELLDKFTDKSTYDKLYAGFYNKAFKGQSSTFGSVISPIVVSAFIFFVTLYLVTGSVSLNFGGYSPAVLLWAGTIATYIMLPETGDDELLAWAWLGATIATKGAYLKTALTLPAIAKALAVVLSAL